MRCYVDDIVQEETAGSTTVSRNNTTAYENAKTHPRLSAVGNCFRTQRVIKRFMQLTFQAMIFPTIATIATFIVRATRFTGVSCAFDLLPRPDLTI